MADLQIDFESEIGKCEFRPASVKEVQDYRKSFPNEAKDRSDEEMAIRLGRIVRTGKTQKMRPTSKAMISAVKLLIERERLSKPFHEVVLKIMQAIGTGDPNEGNIGFWELVSDHLRRISQGKAYARDRKYLRTPHEVHWPHPDAQHVGHLGVFLVPNDEGKPALALRPESLMDALILYAARMRANGTTFQLCEQCKIPFLSGGEGRGGGKRRGDARFCTDECRYTYHNEQRRKSRKA